MRLEYMEIMCLCVCIIMLLIPPAVGINLVQSDDTMSEADLFVTICI